jgi:hypothetical protein
MPLAKNVRMATYVATRFVAALARCELTSTSVMIAFDGEKWMVIIDKKLQIKGQFDAFEDVMLFVIGIVESKVPEPVLK